MSSDSGIPPTNDVGGGGSSGLARGGGAATTSTANTDTGRSLVVDEAFFEEQFLRCQVCHERFDQAERSPKSLPCNHTFCLPCLTQIFDHAQPPARRNLLWADETLDGTLKCPTCRVEIFLSRNKIKELPNDHRVVQMMDFLSQAVAKSHNVCLKHERQPLNFFCKQCLVPVCRDCTVLDHKDSEGHVIIDVSEALNENSPQFNDIENKSRETLEKMKARSDALANASKRLDIIERSLKNEIKETFIEYRLLLEKRQEALTSMVNQIVKDQKTKINATFVSVCEHGTQLQKLYDEFKASKNSNDIRQLFTVNQEMLENEEKFMRVANEDDDELFQSCEFEAQNEGSFLSDMSGLGEVRSKADPELKKTVSAQQLVVLDLEEQRERQRLIDSQLNHFTNCDDSWEQGATSTTTRNIFGDYDGDNGTDANEENPHDDWQEGDAIMSRLIARYARRRYRPMTDAPEAMEEGELSPSVNRRLQRRGRRARDTNSSQVSSSIGEEQNSQELEFLRAARAGMSGNRTSSSGYGTGRPGSRNRQPELSTYRRHPSDRRLQGHFGTDDSN